MSERKAFKSINFDLNTKQLKIYYGKSRRSAYREIENFLKENNFHHRQWSGYVSNEKMGTSDVVILNEKMWEAMPWLEQCARKIDVTDIGKQYDLIWLHKERAAEKKTVNEKEPALSMKDWKEKIKPQNGASKQEMKTQEMKTVAKPTHREDERS